MPVDLKPRFGGGGGHSSGGRSSGGRSSGGRSSGGHSGSGSKPKKPKKPKGGRPIVGGGHRGHHNTSSSSSTTEEKKHKKTSTKKSHKKTKTKDDKEKTEEHKKSKTHSSSTTTTTNNKHHKDQITSIHSFPTTLTLKTLEQRDLSMIIPTMTSTSEHYQTTGASSGSTIYCANDFTEVSSNMSLYVAGGILGLFVVFLAVCRAFKTNKSQEDYLEKKVYYTHLPTTDDSREEMDEKKRRTS